MANCEQCKRELPENAVFCDFCGRRVPAAQGGAGVTAIAGAGMGRETTFSAASAVPSETGTTGGLATTGGTSGAAGLGPASPGSPPAASAPAPAGVAPPPSVAPVKPRRVAATVIQGAKKQSFEYLVEVEGEDAGAVFQLQGDRIVIGRDPGNQVVLTDAKVSAFHAQIQRGPDGSLTIEDQGSTNGTSVNNDPLQAGHRLVDDDVVRVGDTLLQFKRVVPPPAKR